MGKDHQLDLNDVTRTRTRTRTRPTLTRLKQPRSPSRAYPLSAAICSPRRIWAASTWPWNMMVDVVIIVMTVYPNCQSIFSDLDFG